MLHDRDDKYEGSDEPEYHFSDEDGGDGADYAETESTKESAPAPSEPKAETSGGRIAPSKRMMISLAVFLVLVYVVYKMVAPTSQTPSTEITAPVTAQAKTQMSKNPPVEVVKTAPAPVVASAPVVANVPVAQQPAPAPAPLVPMAQQQPVAAPAAPVMPTTQPSMAQQQPAAPTAMPEVSQLPAAPAAAQPTFQPSLAAPVQPQQAPQPVAIAQQPVAPAMQQPSQPPLQAMPQQQAAAQQLPMAPPQQGMLEQQAMPAVIPVQSPTPVVAQNPANTDAKIAVLEADSTKLINQMQSDYVQKLNDFSTQNKALQEQVQTLNSRMATMETQINQLVQALTHQSQGSERGEPAMAPETEQRTSSDQKISYNVQAIIPGRAWLRSDNGETVTVAEGDVIKSLGRVMKIDPYDGVVEINTGSKTVSLSYGTGA